ncbi:MULTISPECIES: LysM peptidoglycan-binding domain-containing protein [unclassified Kribbella]|uniref:LysM peptidoglycan-binding domain-containing protein n=1 Tax=unclassified Kribbella TaxID=2644121 RepID=UPI00301B6055
MIRGLKGILALVALAVLGRALRWMTAGSIGAANSHDLDSMTVLAVGTVAWMAYGWLVLAVLATVLEQIPGVVGAAATAVSGRITSQTSRTLLRSALGLAAVTPLTVGAAQATPGHGAITRPWTQVEPRSTVQPTDTTWRTTKPPSTVRPSGPTFSSTPDATNRRTTEPPSSVRLSRPVTGGATSYGEPDTPNRRTTEPPSSVRLSGSPPAGTSSGTPDASDWRTTEPPSSVRLTGPRPTTSSRPQDVVPAAPQRTTSGSRTENTSGTRASRTAGSTPAGAPADGGTRGEVPGGSRVRVGVPDRPTAGAATRYTDVRSGQPVRVPARVVVKPGDTLWSIAANELGPNSTAEAVAARWPAWYDANRQQIGPDPDLILPGQVLRIPASATGNPVPPTHQEK